MCLNDTFTIDPDAYSRAFFAALLRKIQEAGKADTDQQQQPTEQPQVTP